jgi:GT2 family glycosyltransferase/ADP-heptose:LPS heptosyltransferase
MDRQRKIRECNRRTFAAKPFVPQNTQNGLNALDLFDIIKGKKAIVAPLSQRLRKRAHNTRPPKIKRETQINDLGSLLDTPSHATVPAIEWPTPDWFQYIGVPDVSIVVPLYKSDQVVEDLINSWDLNTNLKTEIIYVDDCCPNDSKNKVIECWRSRRHMPQNGIGKIFYNQTNQGFGTSCNIGAWQAAGKYIIFLNADTLVTPGWIEPIIELLNDPQVGIVGNLQIKYGGPWHGTIDGAGSEWLWDEQTFVHIGRHCYNGRPLVHPMALEQAPPDILKIGEREMVTGCCMAFNRQLFQSFGGFDPNYRIGYWEDSDICLRLREKGYKVMFQPNSKIYHQLGHSAAGRHRHVIHNKNYFFNKWVHSSRIEPLIKSTPSRNTKINAVLIQRQSARGDVLVAASVAPALQKKYKCEVIFNTRCPEILKGNPYIHRVVNNHTVSERQVQLVVNLDMAYEYRPFTNMLEAYADAAGVSAKDCELFLHTTPVDVPKEYIVMHAGKTAWIGRDWSPDKFNAIAQKLTAAGERIVCIGNHEDHAVPCYLDLRTKTSVAQLAHVMKHAKLFIGIDSFPMHVAQTFNVPGVIFFGGILGEYRLFRDNMTAVSVNVTCLGCHHRKLPPCVVTNVCENHNVDCINHLSVDDFWKVIESKL